MIQQTLVVIHYYHYYYYRTSFVVFRVHSPSSIDYLDVNEQVGAGHHYHPNTLQQQSGQYDSALHYPAQDLPDQIGGIVE